MYTKYSGLSERFINSIAVNEFTFNLDKVVVYLYDEKTHPMLNSKCFQNYIKKLEKLSKLIPLK